LNQKKGVVLKGKKKNICFVSFLLFICVLIVIQYYRGHSEEQADTDNPVIYEKEGVRFSYPGNWKIAEETIEGDIHYILVTSPGNALFIIQIFSNLDAIPLQQFAEQFSERAKQEADSMISSYSFSGLEESKDSEGRYSVQENFSINVFGVQGPHIRRYYSVTNNEKTAYLISQAVTEDLTKVEAGFSLILNSLFLK
jgi:hypothetical protein